MAHLYLWTKVTGPIFVCQCAGCGRTLNNFEAQKFNRTEEVWADRNGQTFKSYYCKPCKDRICESDDETHDRKLTPNGEVIYKG